MRSGSTWWVGVLSAIGIFYATIPAASAGEIKLMCPPPMRTAIVDLVAQFERQTSHKVEIIHIPSRFIIDRVRGGEAVDVTILTAAATDGLIKEGKLVRRTDVARSSIGIAVLDSAPKPDASNAEALKRTLLAAKSFARNEGAESGAHIVSVFEKLGITELMKAKTKPIPINSGYVAERVASGEVEMAAQQMPELKAVKGVAATPLPPELQLYIVFAAGRSATSKDAAAVEALESFLRSTVAHPVLREKGLDPL